MVCGGTVSHTRASVNETRENSGQFKGPGRIRQSNHYEFLLRGGQHLTTLLRDHHHVFDAHPPLAGQINSRLNLDPNPWPESFLLPWSHAGSLVNFEPHSMPG